MATLYDSPDVFDVFENEQKEQDTRRHWERLFSGKEIHSVLDVSIGSGNLTLPLADMGIELYGSDLSEAMLRQCGKKAADRGQKVDLRVCDFRRLEGFGRKFDCVLSTGNSLPYVSNDEVMEVLGQMDALVERGGYLYFDVRNWDHILSTKQRFFLYPPHFDAQTRINLVQVWDYHPDDSMTFNLLFTFERENRFVRKEIFEEHYYPVRRKLLLTRLEELGYVDIRVLPFPAQRKEFDPDTADWYCVLAHKAG